MARLTVEVDEDHLSDIVRGPGVGLQELIWNALDAEAKRVTVATGTTALGAVEDIYIVDDGHGMTHQEAKNGFGALGGSWKKAAKVTKNEGRSLHGERGKGRFAAFGLGDHVQWRSVSEDEQGERTEVLVSGNRANLREFDVSDPLGTDQPIGTEVRIEFVPESSAKWLDRPTLPDTLAATFALYLEAYPDVEIVFRGQRLDPRSMQAARTEFDLHVPGAKDRVKLVIIEWLRSVERALHLCSETGAAQLEVKPGIQAPGIEFTAYLKWSGFKGHNALLADLGSEPMHSIVEAAKDKMREHFKARTLEKQSAVIGEWIAEKVYPYPEAVPPTAVANAERQMFDIVAFAAAPAINNGDIKSKELSLHLLKESIESNPTSLRKVLGKVLKLPKERLDELDRLLDRTSLTAIINTAKMVGDRLSFLSGLDTILFDLEPRKETLERRQLHRILANETWVFGEEYALTGDDEPLNKVLKKYLAFLGEDVELADDSPILRHDGRKPIPDLVLSRTSEIAQDRVENLVIELKRPKVTLGADEITQIEKYAHAVLRDERFNKPNVTWDFWLVGNSIDEFAEVRRDQQGLPYGYVQRTNTYSIQVRTWSEVINAAKHRLKFVEKNLDYRATHDDGLEYLRRTHAKYLPPSLSEEAVSDSASSEHSEDSGAAAS